MPHLGVTLLAVLSLAASTLAFALLGLIARRVLQERKALSEASRAKAFRADLLANLQDADSPVLKPWRGDPVALDVIIHLLQLVRGNERVSMLAIGERLELLSAALARLASKRPVHRIAAIRRLGNFPVASVQSALNDRLASDSCMEVRLEAGLALARLLALPEPGEVVAALDDGSFASPAHRLVLRATAREHADAFPLLWAAQRDAPARFAIVDALGELVTDAGLTALLDAVVAPEPQLRCEALRALRRLGHPGAATAVLASLDDPEWIVRVQAASAAGALRIAAARPRLEALSQDAHWWVRHRAGEALARLPKALAA